jgi:hypothetical protein
LSAQIRSDCGPVDSGNMPRTVYNLTSRRKKIVRLPLTFTIIVLTLPSVCIAQTSSSSLAKNDIQGQYRILKSVYAKQNLNLSSTTRPNARTVYDLNACAPAAPEFNAADRMTSNMAGLAAEILLSAATLKWMGYPDPVWQPALSQYEQLQLNSMMKTGAVDHKISYDSSELLIKRLDLFRAQSAISLPKARWETECGGSGLSVTVKTVPPGGKLSIIPLLFHSFCSAQGLKSNSITECNQWIEVSDGEELLVSGVYFYRASWKDGSSAQGRKDTDKIPESNTQQYWVVRASGG